MRVTVAVILLLIASISVVGGYWYIATPGSGVVTKQGTELPQTQGTELPQSLNGVTFRADVPAGYEQRAITADVPDIESYRIFSERNHQQTISIYATRLASQRLEDHAAYMLRASQPAVYQKESAMLDGQPATAWTARNGSEKTIFCLRADTLVVVAIGSPEQAADHRAAASQLINSFRWQ